MITLADNKKGFTLVEIVITIILIGVLASIAVRNMSTTLDTAKYEHTKKELDQLAYAIVGNPNVYTKGARTDFGYVGDIGALPANLDALVSNPGGYTTWDGPYINQGNNSIDFKQDGWNVDYVYLTTLVRSTGSGSDIDKVFAASSSALLLNTVEGFVVDANNNVPGVIYKDSLSVHLTYPDGTGNLTTASVLPGKYGNFSFTNIPIGSHTLSVIYIPDTDTVSFNIAVNPSSTVKLNITFPADLW